MKFRKKPVVVEAVQFRPDVPLSVESAPTWLCNALLDRTTVLRGSTLVIKTLEGEMTAEPGDWIIRGVKGELYPCKPDIFEVTYEPA